MKTNTYGYKMHGLRKAAGYTKDLHGCGRVQISYDCNTGDILTDYHYNKGDWTQYRNPDIITICTTGRPMTMQQIADEIVQELADIANIASGKQRAC